MKKLLKDKSILVFLVIFVFAGILRIISLNFPFGDFDEGTYSAMLLSFLHGHPLITQTYSSQFPLFIYLLIPFYKLSATITGLRMLPVLCSLSILLCTYVMVRRYVDTWVACIAAAYLGVNSLVLMVSRTLQLDIPWTACTLISFFFLMYFQQTRKHIYSSLSALFFAASILIKVNPIFAGVVIVYIFYLFATSWKQGLYVCMEFIAIFAAFALLVIPFNAMPLLYHQAISIRTSLLGLSYFSSSLSTRTELFQHEWPIILLDLIAIGILASNIFHKHYLTFRDFFEEELFMILSCIWLFITALAMVLYNPLFPHHLVFFVIPATLVSGYTIWYAFKYTKVIFLTILIVLFLLYHSAITGMTDIDITSPKLTTGDQYTLSATQYITSITAPNEYVITDQPIMLFLAHRQPVPDLVDVSFVRIESHGLSSKEMIQDTIQYQVRVVVFATNRLAMLKTYQKYLDKKYTKVTFGGIVIYQKTS